MEWRIVLWFFVIMMFIIMVVVMIRGANAWVYVFDRFNSMKKIRAKEKDGKVAFKYNTASKGGISIEENVYKHGKKKVYFYRDENGILLPISDKILDEKHLSFDLSTSQEKQFETEALKNVVAKIDNTWWAQIKSIAVSAILIFGAMIVSIVMIQNAMQIEPVPEPQVMMFNNVTKAMIDLTETNKELILEVRGKEVKSTKEKVDGGGTPK